MKKYILFLALVPLFLSCEKGNGNVDNVEPNNKVAWSYFSNDTSSLFFTDSMMCVYTNSYFILYTVRCDIERECVESKLPEEDGIISHIIPAMPISLIVPYYINGNLIIIDRAGYGSDIYKICDMLGNMDDLPTNLLDTIILRESVLDWHGVLFYREN